MRIAFNALGLKNNTGGVEAHIYNLIENILIQDDRNKYFLFIGKNTQKVFENLKLFKNLKIIVFPINTNNSTIRVLAEHSILALSLIFYRINLIHHLCNYMPRICPAKSITTIHDLLGFFNHEHFEHTSQMERYYKYAKKAIKYTLKKSSKIIVISEFTRSEVHKYYDVDDSKMVTIGMSLDSRKQKFEPNGQRLAELGISSPYLLSVSVVRPHKNYAFLVKVFNYLKEKYKIPHQLVIVGGIQVNAQNFIDEIKDSSYKNDIKYLGYVTNEDLASLYKYAGIYVTTSLYEGFGMPLMEAMIYNLPIASSNTASLPEVGGEGAIYFNPYDVKNAGEIIYKLISNDELQKKIKSKQQERLDFYSWDKVAKKMISEYNDVFHT